MFETLLHSYEFAYYEKVETSEQCEDLTDKGEFISESMHTIVTKSSPVIPQQCGNKNGVDWSSLSRTQKKKMKAKTKVEDSKDAVITCKTTEELGEMVGNPFAKQYDLPRLTLHDPLILSLQKIIDEQLGTVKLDDKEVEIIIVCVNRLKMLEWWNVGWTLKCEFLKTWFEK